MSFSLFDIKDLERGLDLCSFRNNVISSNIANANSPDYQVKVVAFEEQMQRVASEKSGKIRFAAKLEPSIQSVSGSVDIISEMANLSKNQILYHAYSGEVTRHFSNLKWIIDNAGR